MPRPIEQGEAAILRDVENMNRALKRVVDDRKRPRADRRVLERHLRASILLHLKQVMAHVQDRRRPESESFELERHLRAAMALLANGKRTGRVSASRAA